MLKLGTAVMSDEAVLRSFQDSSRDILRIAEDHDLGVLSQQILIPRLQGIEDSNRNWSVLMAVEHLSIFNRSILETVRSLHSNSQPFDKVVIAKFKPHDDVGGEAIEQFRETNQRYWSFVKSHQPLRTVMTHGHPWLGELDGHAWHFLAAAHQKIHRRQIYKILAMIGVP